MTVLESKMPREKQQKQLAFTFRMNWGPVVHRNVARRRGLTGASVGAGGSATYRADEPSNDAWKALQLRKYERTGGWRKGQNETVQRLGWKEAERGLVCEKTVAVRASLGGEPRQQPRWVEERRSGAHISSSWALLNKRVLRRLSIQIAREGGGGGGGRGCCSWWWWWWWWRGGRGVLRWTWTTHDPTRSNNKTLFIQLNIYIFYAACMVSFCFITHTAKMY